MLTEKRLLEAEIFTLLREILIDLFNALLSDNMSECNKAFFIKIKVFWILKTLWRNLKNSELNWVALSVLSS